MQGGRCSLSGAQGHGWLAPLPSLVLGSAGCVAAGSILTADCEGKPRRSCLFHLSHSLGAPQPSRAILPPRCRCRGLCKHNIHSASLFSCRSRSQKMNRETEQKRRVGSWEGRREGGRGRGRERKEGKIAAKCNRRASQSSTPKGISANSLTAHKRTPCLFYTWILRELTWTDRALSISPMSSHNKSS